MECKIIRIEYSEDGILGVMQLERKCFCVTLELPWYDNQSNVSAIPNGDYICYRFQSFTRGDVWELQDVPERYHIQIHAGNTVKDTLGCILVAQYFGKLQGNRAVLNSGKTFTEFMNITRNVNKLDLRIDSYIDLSKFRGHAL